MRSIQYIGDGTILSCRTICYELLSRLIQRINAACGGDKINSLLKQLAEIKQKLEAAHPEVKLWAVELFKDQGKAFCRSATTDAPPWFKTQHERFGGLYSVQ